MGTQSTYVPQVVPSVIPGRPTYLMCSPQFYDVNYVINPWMAGNLHAASPHRAMQQWQGLYKTLCEIADVMLIAPQPALPDMVFTANAGLQRNRIVVPSRFAFAERSPEESFFRRWFLQAGYTILDLPCGTSFEGEGDALFSSDGLRLWAACGMRTQEESHSYLGRAFGVEATSLRLIDPRFYHLDTCFAPLTEDYLMYYRAAFDAAALIEIERFYPVDRRIAVSQADASRFACNAINVGRDILVNEISRELIDHLEREGFHVTPLPLAEFVKAGGAAKCLIMQLYPADTKVPG